MQIFKVQRLIEFTLNKTGKLVTLVQIVFCNKSALVNYKKKGFRPEFTYGNPIIYAHKDTQKKKKK